MKIQSFKIKKQIKIIKTKQNKNIKKHQVKNDNFNNG